MSAALTPWFAADVKPVRVGVYETRTPNFRGGYSLWTGTEWHAEQDTSDEAYRENVFGSKYINQKKRWRGLASDPSVKP